MSENASLSAGATCVVNIKHTQIYSLFSVHTRGEENTIQCTKLCAKIVLDYGRQIHAARGGPKLIVWVCQRNSTDRRHQANALIFNSRKEGRQCKRRWPNIGWALVRVFNVRIAHYYY